MVAPRFVSRGNIESWLTTVARNEALDYLRRSSHEITYCDGTEWLPTCDESVEAEVLLRALRVEVYGAMKRLDAPKRSAMFAAFVDGMTHDGIAKSTHLPLGTVKTRLRSGIAELRRVLAS